MVLNFFCFLVTSYANYFICNKVRASNKRVIICKYFVEINNHWGTRAIASRGFSIKYSRLRSITSIFKETSFLKSINLWVPAPSPTLLYEIVFLRELQITKHIFCVFPSHILTRVITDKHFENCTISIRTKNKVNAIHWKGFIGLLTKLTNAKTTLLIQRTHRKE